MVVVGLGGQRGASNGFGAVNAWDLVSCEGVMEVVVGRGREYEGAGWLDCGGC